MGISLIWVREVPEQRGKLYSNLASGEEDCRVLLAVLEGTWKTDKGHEEEGRYMNICIFAVLFVCYGLVYCQHGRTGYALVQNSIIISIVLSSRKDSCVNTTVISCIDIQMSIQIQNTCLSMPVCLPLQQVFSGLASCPLQQAPTWEQWLEGVGQGSGNIAWNCALTRLSLLWQ